MNATGRGALRLIFSYRGRAIALERWIRVDVIAPPSDRLPDVEAQTGFWYELRDAKEQSIYVRGAHNPLRAGIEAPTGDAARPFVRHAVPEPAGWFALLVPALESARTLVIFSPPLDERGSGLPARELARFELPVDPARAR